MQAWRETRGPRDPQTVMSLTLLASLYHAQGRYGEAETLLQRARAGRERALGPEHPETLAVLGNLGALFRERIQTTTKRELIVFLTPKLWRPGCGTPLTPGVLNGEPNLPLFLPGSRP